MHNRSALWQRRKINHCDLAHGRVEIKPSHVENRLSVTPPVASRAPSPHTITCKPPLHIQTASELLGAPWWTGLLVCRCCALTLLYVTWMRWGSVSSLGIRSWHACSHVFCLRSFYRDTGFILQNLHFSAAKSQRLALLLSCGISLYWRSSSIVIL